MSHKQSLSMLSWLPLWSLLANFTLADVSGKFTFPNYAYIGIPFGTATNLTWTLDDPTSHVDLLISQSGHDYIAETIVSE
jgi:hypothetical protein